MTILVRGSRPGGSAGKGDILALSRPSWAEPIALSAIALIVVYTGE